MDEPSTHTVSPAPVRKAGEDSLASRSARARRKEDPRNKIIGQCLRDARVTHGLSMQQMAEKAGVHWSSVGKYEKGQQAIPLAYVYLVSRITGVPIGDLFDPAAARSRPAKVVNEADEMSAVVWHWIRIPEPNIRRAIVTLVRNIAQARS